MIADAAPLRPLFLTESFHPVLGGGEGHIRELATRLALLGQRPSVLTRRGEEAWPTEEVLDGIRVLRVGPPGPGRSGKYRMLPAVQAALRRELAEHDLLVVRGTRVLGLPGVRAARGSGRPVVLQPEVNGEFSGEVFTWGTRLEHGPAGRLVRFALNVSRRSLRRADACVAMSRQIRDEIVASGVASDRVHLIPHGVDLKRFHPADRSERMSLRQRLALPEAPLLVVWTGRVLRGKGLPELLEAFAGLGEFDARLLLVGSGQGQALSIESELRARAAAEDLAGRVLFAGRQDDVAPYLQSADLFVFPSIFEALGIALLEASACGLAAIGARTGGIVDVIEDGRSGRLVEPGDARQLREALRSLLADADARARLGGAARRIAEQRFDRDASVERYRALFSDLSR